jgi:hypothetical protein
MTARGRVAAVSATAVVVGRSVVIRVVVATVGVGVCWRGTWVVHVVK